jgi:hypothetical protein
VSAPSLLVYRYNNKVISRSIANDSNNSKVGFWNGSIDVTGTCQRQPSSCQLGQRWPPASATVVPHLHILKLNQPVFSQILSARRWMRMKSLDVGGTQRKAPANHLSSAVLRMTRNIANGPGLTTTRKIAPNLFMKHAPCLTRLQFLGMITVHVRTS